MGRGGGGEPARPGHDPGNLAAAYNLASAEVARGNAPWYAAACTAMTRRFATAAGEASYRTFQAVAPNPTALDAAGWLQLGEKAKGFGGPRVQAAALYRAGRPAEAARSFGARLTEPRGWEMLFRSMAHRKAGNAAQADQWLARARVWIEEADRVDRDPTAWAWPLTRWEDWNEQVAVAALLREATPAAP